MRRTSVGPSPSASEALTNARDYQSQAPSALLSNHLKWMNDRVLNSQGEGPRNASDVVFPLLLAKFDDFNFMLEILQLS